MTRFYRNIIERRRRRRTRQRRNRRRHSQPEQSEEASMKVIINFPETQHPWLNFPEDLPVAERIEYFSRLHLIIDKDIEVPKGIDWTICHRAGFLEEIYTLLRQQFCAPNGSVLFTCEAWWRLISIRQPIFKELVWEFFSTVKFNSDFHTFENENAITFRLGGEKRQCSLTEFSVRLGLYTYEETQNSHFQAFLQSCLLRTSPEFRATQFWGTIGDMIETRWVTENDIKSPILRLLHRLIVTSISHRREQNMVSSMDLFYMWCMMNRKLVNVPYGVAYFLGNHAAGIKEEDPNCCGELITELALSYDLLDPEEYHYHGRTRKKQRKWKESKTWKASTS